MTPDLHLVAGARRLAAVELLGWETVPIFVVESLDEAARLEAEVVENTVRKAFAPSERVAAAAKLKVLLEPKAEEKQKAQGDRGKEGGRGNKTHTTNDSKGSRSSDRNKRTTTALAATAVGTTASDLIRSEKVVEAAKQQPELFAKIVEKMDATGNVNRAYKEVRRIREQEELRRAAEELAKQAREDDIEQRGAPS